MNIYTLVMTKESFSDPPVMEVVGSFRTGVKAKKALVEKIVEMAQKDKDFAFALFYDENHSDFQGKMSSYETSFLREAEAIFPEELEVAMRNYLNQDIGDEEGAYYVYCAAAYDLDATYRFEVKKNELNPEEWREDT